MRRRISLPVAVLPVFPRHRLFQGRRHVPPHVRIRPFLEGHRRGGVRDEHVEQAVPPSLPGGGLLQ